MYAFAHWNPMGYSTVSYPRGVFEHRTSLGGLQQQETKSATLEIEIVIDAAMLEQSTREWEEAKGARTESLMLRTTVVVTATPKAASSSLSPFAALLTGVSFIDQFVAMMSNTLKFLFGSYTSMLIGVGISQNNNKRTQALPINIWVDTKKTAVATPIPSSAVLKKGSTRWEITSGGTKASVNATTGEITAKAVAGASDLKVTVTDVYGIKASATARVVTIDRYTEFKGRLTKDCYLYRGPGTTYEKAIKGAQLSAGTHLTILGKCGDWWYVTEVDGTGTVAAYIHKDNVTRSEYIIYSGSLYTNRDPVVHDGSNYRAIDISGSGIKDTPLYALAGGTLQYKTRRVKCTTCHPGKTYYYSVGAYAEITYDNGYIATYGHMGEFAFGRALPSDTIDKHNPRLGQANASSYGTVINENVGSAISVKKGDYIGIVGDNGNSSGPHLHFFIQKNGTSPFSSNRAAVNYYQQFFPFSLDYDD